MEHESAPFFVSISVVGVGKKSKLCEKFLAMSGYRCEKQVVAETFLRWLGVEAKSLLLEKI